MKSIERAVAAIATSLAVFLLSACGGGDSNSVDNVPPPPVNNWDQMNWDQGNWQN